MGDIGVSFEFTVHTGEDAGRLVQLAQAPRLVYGEEQGKVDDEVSWSTGAGAWRR